MSRSVRIFLTTMFGLVVASGFYTGCGPGDECQTNADCKTAGQVCKLTNGAKKCTAGSSEGTNPDGGTPDGTGNPDGEAVTNPDGEAVTNPDGEAVTNPDGETVTEQPPTEQVKESTGNGSVGDICTQDPNNPSGTCQAGLICLGITQTEARCFQDCTANNALCAANTDGRTDCEAVTADGSVSVCLNNNATEGQDCGFGNKSQARCKQDNNTPNQDLYCSATTQKCAKPEIKSNVGDPCNKENDNSEPLKICDRSGAKPLACDPNTGTCIEQTIVGTLEKCGGVKGCGNDDVCVSINFGDTVGSIAYCLKKCTPGAGAACPGNAECLQLNTPGTGACRWAGALKQNDACTNIDPNKDKIDTTTLCEGGLDCIGLNGTKPICIQIWEGNCQTPGKTCAAGNKCVGLQGGTQTYGGCFADCAGGKACPTGLECNANLGDACLGEAPVGPVALGGLCSTDTTKVATEGCKKGLFCLGLQGAAQGVCSADCGADPSVCNGAASGTMTCVDINPQTGAKACVFPCSGAGQTCPQGTTCNSSVGVCLP